jgi:CBS domain-containing protein
MIREVQTITPRQSAIDAFSSMSRNNYRRLVVVDDGGVGSAQTMSFAIARTNAVGGTLRPGERIDVLATYGSGEGTYTAYVVRGVPLLRLTAPAGGGPQEKLPAVASTKQSSAISTLPVAPGSWSGSGDEPSSAPVGTVSQPATKNRQARPNNRLGRSARRRPPTRHPTSMPEGCAEVFSRAPPCRFALAIRRSTRRRGSPSGA